MHTTVFDVFSAHGVLLGCILVLLGVGASSPQAAAQPSFPGAPDEPNVDLRVYPMDFWGPRFGPGVGVGLVGHNLARQNDQWLLTAAPARYEQVATLGFASANPRRARRYVLVDTRALHTDRDWFGPSSRRTVLERTALRGRVRMGQSLLDRRLLLQPHATVSHHRVDAVSQPTNRPTATVAPPAPGSHHTGLRAGLDLQYDTRDHPVLTTKGLLLQGTWERYVPLDGSSLQFDQFDLDGYGYVPFGGRHRLVTRLSMTMTRSQDSAPVPLYMLPTLGGTVVPGWARGRFVAPDRLMTSALYRFPLIYYNNLGGIEGHVGLHLASVYNSIGKQFTTTVSFKEDVSPKRPDRPLRPTASVGLQFAMPFRPFAMLDLTMGLSPEGVTAIQLSFVRSLHALRFPHHTSENI